MRDEPKENLRGRLMFSCSYFFHPRGSEIVNYEPQAFWRIVVLQCTHFPVLKSADTGPVVVVVEGRGGGGGGALFEHSTRNGFNVLFEHVKVTPRPRLRSSRSLQIRFAR